MTVICRPRVLECPPLQFRRLSQFMLPVVAAFSYVQSAQAATFSFSAAMQSAASARQVPLPLVEAIAYVNSRWEVIDVPALDGGVGPMHILPAQLARAAALSGHTTGQVTSDPAANLDAGAALLAAANPAGGDLDSWRPAVASIQGDRPTRQVYDALAQGARTGSPAAARRSSWRPSTCPRRRQGR